MPGTSKWTRGLLALVAVFTSAIGPWAWAGIVVRPDQLVTYDGQNNVSEAVGDLSNGPDPQPLPSLQDLSTFDSAVATGLGGIQTSALIDVGGGVTAAASAGSPQLVVGSGENTQFLAPVFTGAKQLSTQSQANQVPDVPAAVGSQSGPLGFWSDGNPASPTDVLAAFRNSGLGSVSNTVLAPGNLTPSVDVSAYVVIPLSDDALTDGGVPEASTFVMWGTVGSGGIILVCWRRRRSSLVTRVSAAENSMNGCFSRACQSSVVIGNARLNRSVRA